MNDLALRDIHLPDTGLWWPPAPGWWMIALGLVLLIPGVIFLRRWHKHQSTRELSITEIKRIRRDFDRQRDKKLLIGQLSTLLRRILISYRGRHANAGLTGDRWIGELNDLVECPCFDDDQVYLFAQGQFQRDIEFDDRALIASCENWIKALPRGRHHVAA